MSRRQTVRDGDDYSNRSRLGRSREVGLAHQITVAFARRAATLIESPDNQALAAPAIARREYSRNTGRIFPILSFHISAWVTVEAKLIHKKLLWPEKAHRQQHKLRGKHSFCARKLLWRKLSFLVLCPLNLDGM